MRFLRNFDQNHKFRKKKIIHAKNLCPKFNSLKAKAKISIFQKFHLHLHLQFLEAMQPEPTAYIN